jgi:predicted PurR-regulated permease PerM
MQNPAEKWISITTGTIFRAILVVLFFAAIFYLRDVALIVLLSVVVASAIEPGARWLVRRNVPRLLSVILIYLCLVFFLIGIFYFLFLPLLTEAVNFLSSLPGYLGDLEVWNPISSNGFLSSGPLQGLGESLSLVDIVNQLDTTIDNFSSGFFSTASAIFGGIFSMILVIVLSFYLSVESDGVTSFLRIVIPYRHEAYILDLWKRSQKKIGLWMQGQIVLAVLIAILTFLGLTLLQVENALLLAVIAGIFEIIPVFGPILAAIPAIIISLVSGGLSSALLVLGLYVIIQQFENQLIYPLVVKKVVGVPPIVSILALIIGGKLAGFIGLIISVPMAAVLMEFLNDWEKKKIARSSAAKSSSDTRDTNG